MLSVNNTVQSSEEHASIDSDLATGTGLLGNQYNVMGAGMQHYFDYENRFSVLVDTKLTNSATLDLELLLTEEWNQLLPGL